MPSAYAWQCIFWRPASPDNRGCTVPSLKVAVSPIKLYLSLIIECIKSLWSWFFTTKKANYKAYLYLYTWQSKYTIKISLKWTELSMLACNSVKQPPQYSGQHTLVPWWWGFTVRTSTTYIEVYQAWSIFPGMQQHLSLNAHIKESFGLSIQCSTTEVQLIQSLQWKVSIKLTFVQ